MLVWVGAEGTFLDSSREGARPWVERVRGEGPRLLRIGRTRRRRTDRAAVRRPQRDARASTLRSSVCSPPSR